MVSGHVGINRTTSALRLSVFRPCDSSCADGHEVLRDLSKGQLSPASGNPGGLLSKEVPHELKHEEQEVGQLHMFRAKGWGEEGML